MIRYALTCDQDHQFESWFQSADAFDKLLSCGMVTCAVCGSEEVRKSIMAPRIGKATDTNTDPNPRSSKVLAATTLTSFFHQDLLVHYN